MRQSVFSNVLGEDFVSIAFEAAKQADPDAKLYINDYNLDSASYAKTQGLANKVKQWLSEGVPIDGIGSQSHLQAGQRGTGDALAYLADTGVSEVAITELDIGGGAADDYVAAVQGCLDVEKCIGESHDSPLNRMEQYADCDLRHHRVGRYGLAELEVRRVSDAV